MGRSKQWSLEQCPSDAFAIIYSDDKYGYIKLLTDESNGKAAKKIVRVLNKHWNDKTVRVKKKSIITGPNGNDGYFT